MGGTTTVGQGVGIEWSKSVAVNAHDSDGMANFMSINVKNSNACGWLKVVHAVPVGFGAAQDGCEMVGVLT